MTSRDHLALSGVLFLALVVVAGLAVSSQVKVMALENKVSRLNTAQPDTDVSANTQAIQLLSRRLDKQLADDSAETKRIESLETWSTKMVSYVDGVTAKIQAAMNDNGSGKTVIYQQAYQPPESHPLGSQPDYSACTSALALQAQNNRYGYPNGDQKDTLSRVCP